MGAAKQDLKMDEKAGFMKRAKGRRGNKPLQKFISKVMRGIVRDGGRYVAQSVCTGTSQHLTAHQL